MIGYCLLAVVGFYTLFFTYVIKSQREGVGAPKPVLQ
jgi:hypothetical protein